MIPFHLPKNPKLAKFYYTGSIQRWEVPEDASLLFILACGGGGAGGNGFGAAANAARGGGGGGASGSVIRMVLPALLLPKTLWMDVGIGSSGSGGSTSIGVTPISTPGAGAKEQASRLFLCNGGANGNNGSGASGGNGGAAGGTPSIITSAYLGLSAMVVLNGQVGAAGGAQTGAVGGAVVWSNGNGHVISSGAGGAGCTTTTFAGGSVTMNSNPMFPSAVNGGAAGANPGDHGYIGDLPLTFVGGAGAGSSNTVAGANGGDGAPGCGGGGGGAGVTTGGTGGKGGSGFVFIAWA